MNLYQEEILDHYKHPRNKGRLEGLKISAESSNPLCGDKLGLDLKVEKELVKGVGFWGEGCAISQAAMSMLSEELVGKSLSDIKKITKDDILEMLGVEISGARLKCALLCLTVIESI